jgi:hypothetical protein
MTSDYARSDMRKKLKRFTLLIFALSALILFCLAYPQWKSLGEIRLLSSNLTVESFESADQQDLVMDFPVQLKSILSASVVNQCCPGIQPFKDSFPFSYQPFFHQPKIFILRC